jgi:alkanesulfonate monooxygenase SsuD/methylene tetrahydromethanopterin reductase-like flavin-dependent oxidoreductase (luciferase family)
MMRLVALLTPTPDWASIVAGARAADEAGLDGAGFWDHYHSDQPEWAYVCGWSAYGAIAAVTSRLKLVPMVLNNLHYQPGVLAKESSILARLSGGRFELGIGAGDWPSSFDAWGERFPEADERLDRLVETIKAVRLAWTGGPVDYGGRYVRLTGAICTPAPSQPPRVVVGVGGSRRTLHRVLDVADEVNLYPDENLVNEARQAISGLTRTVALSVFVSWEWDKWPADPATELDAWHDRGIERLCVSLAGPDMVARIDALAAWAVTRA